MYPFQGFCALGPKTRTVLRLSVAFVLLAAASVSFADSLQLASRLERPPLTGGANVGDLSTSADGRYVVFSNDAPLIGNDTNGGNDVFLFDRVTETITLVSHALGNPGQAGDDGSFGPKISADGTTVVFTSWATDLSATSDTNGMSDVFLWRRETQETTLVSRGLSGESANRSSETPDVDGTGSRVAFESFATDLATGTDGNGFRDVFLWQQATGTTTLVSHATGAPSVASNGESFLLGLDEAGDGVLVRSTARDLVTAFVDRNSGGLDLFHWRRSTGTTRLVSRSTLGDATSSTRAAGLGQLSADGSSVVFTHSGQDLIPGFLGIPTNNLFQWDTTTGDMLLISHSQEGLASGANGSSFDFSLSQDGATVAFDSTASNLTETDGNGVTDVYLWQRAGSTVELISRTFQFPLAANGSSSTPRLSRDGTVLSFLSDASDLVAGFVPAASGQVYVWRAAQGIMLVSRASAGPTQAANANTDQSLPTADGGAILFPTSATDIIENVDSGLFAFNLATEDISLLNGLCRPVFPLMDSPAGDALEASVSDDGRFVVFAGSARPLIDDIEFTESTGQVYLWDGATGEVTLVSHSIAGPLTAANGGASVAKISGDGRWVAFRSSATDLVPGYVSPSASNPTQAYLWDRLSGDITLITASFSSATQGADDRTLGYAMSSDGRFVVLSSDATDLLPGVSDGNDREDLYLWERTTGAVQLITKGPAGSTANGGSSNPSISADGEFVAFVSSASDLVSGTDLNHTGDIFLWQRSTDTVTLVSHIAGDAATTDGVSPSSEPHISDDGNVVVFSSSAEDLVSPPIVTSGNRSVFRWSRLTDTLEWITPSVVTPGAGGDRSASDPLTNVDGSVILFVSEASDLQNDVVDDNDRKDVFYWTEASGQVRLLSRSGSDPGFAGNSDSDEPQLSADGTRVVFISRATDLIAGETSVSDDLYSWDAASNTLRRLTSSIIDPLRGGEAQSDRPTLSADGSTVAFDSNADDLLPGVYDGSRRQIFVEILDDPVDLELRIAPVLNPAPTGEIYSYTVDVANLSADGALHAMLFVSLPPGETFVDATGPGWSCRHAAGKLSCRRRGSLPAGQAVDPLVVRLVAPPVAGTSDLHATLNWPGIDPDLANNVVVSTTLFASADWGDAPDPGYPTLAASDGASHGFGPLFLGSALDVDVDGQPSVDADGDTLDGTLDEDGIVFVAPIVVGQGGDLEVTASAAGLLDAWIDWNTNGNWEDTERIFTGQAVAAGVNLLSISAPMAAQTGTSFARFRLSSAGIAAPTGRAVDGEVEDYAVQVDTVGLSATLDASPLDVPEVGGDVTFTVAVTNDGTQTAILTALQDDLIGDLDGQGDCTVPQLVTAGGTYNCSYNLSLSGPVDGSETHALSVDGASLGFTLTAEDSATVTFFDSIAPNLLGYATLPDTGDGPLVDCATVRLAPREILITFDEQLEEGPGGVDDPAAYRLLRPGADASFETTECGSVEPSDDPVGIDVAYAVGADRFDPSIAALMTGGDLADGLYRLLICDGLQDLGGNVLPGGDLRLDFRVDDGNRFRNGHFDCTIDSWEQAPPSMEMGYEVTDADNSAQSGSLRVASQLESSFGLGQCLPIGGEVELLFETGLRLDTLPDTPVDIAQRCLFFVDDACRSPLLGSVSPNTLQDTDGLFTSLSFQLTTPLGARSMDCGFDIEGTGTGFDLYLDQVTLDADLTLFEDGFESGDTSTWSNSVP